MKRKIGVAGLLVLLVLGATAPSALAQCGGQLLIKFDADCFSYESSVTQSVIEGGNSIWKSNPGSSLTVVGLATLFCSPLNGNVPNLPVKEYSFVWSGLTSAGTVQATYIVNGKKWDTDYSGGVFAFYEDSPADAPRATTPMPINPPAGGVPVNFQNGTLILSGTLNGLHTVVTRSNNTASAIWGGSFTTTYQFTGGPQYSATPGPTQVGPGVNTLFGNWCGKYPSGCVPTGYTGHPNGDFDYAVATDARSSTWGAIKQLYR